MRSTGARRSAKPKAAKKDAYHHGDLRRALIDAAVGMIVDSGASSVALREVARRAGVSQAAPYRHFADKDALVAAVAEEGHRLMYEAMREAIAPVEDAMERFRDLGVAYVEFAVKHPGHFRVMFGPICADLQAYPSLAEQSSSTFQLLLQSVDECQHAKLVRKGDRREIALFAWTVVHGLASLLVDGQLKATDYAAKPLRPIVEHMLLLAFEGMVRR